MILFFPRADSYGILVGFEVLQTSANCDILVFHEQGVKAEILAQRMGYDRRLPPNMIKALEQRLQEEIDKRNTT